MKISKYTRLGFLMVFSITALIWGLSYLKGRDFFKPVDYYHARYERVDGLVESSHVTMNGYKIGSVKSIEFEPGHSGNLIVTFMVDNDFRIPKNSLAKIVSSDIMGTRSIKLIFSEEQEFYTSGDTIPGAIEGDLKEQVSLQVLPLKSKAEELLATLDSAVTVLTVIFNEDARQNLSESFANINRTVYNIEKTSADLRQLMADEKGNISSIIRNMATVSGTVKDNSAEIQNIIQNLSAFSDTLSSLSVSPILVNLGEATAMLRDLLAKLNSDENTAGLLFNDDQLYNNVVQLSANLSQLMVDVRNNPKRYVHFSAVDLGKEVYINATDQASGNKQNIIFKVHLISTPNKMPLNSPLFAGLGDIEEYAASGAFSYLAGNFKSYKEASTLLTTAYRSFPDATIVAFRNGKILKLERALRMMKE